MKDIVFNEISKKVHLIKDSILFDMTCGVEDSSQATINFGKHLLASKFWFARISWVNKKRFVLALMEDVRSVWTLSLLLKSMWNCRLKDSVLSSSDSSGTWTSYDQVPMDHNRAAQSLSTLASVMTTDRTWFLSLNAEYQALVLAELLTIAGGPIMWSVLSRAQLLYVKHNEKQLSDLVNCSVIVDPGAHDVKGKKETHSTIKLTEKHQPVKEQVGDVQEQTKRSKELEAHLAAWNSMIKSLRDSMKLEELKMVFNDGTTRLVWKVNRTKPEAIETVDYLQLLPAKVARRILSYLPVAQLPECAKVNKYWAFLVDELRAETVARQKLDADIDKMQEIVFHYDTSMEMIGQMDFAMELSSKAASMAPSVKKPLPSLKPSEKSAGAYSFGRFVNDRLCRAGPKNIKVPIHNMREMTERLDQRGAADENLWIWCAKILKRNKLQTDDAKTQQTGVLRLNKIFFPCPLMKEKIQVPLTQPLCKDPAISKSTKPKRNALTTTMVVAKEHELKRFKLWSRDFSGLYPVMKIPAYQALGFMQN